MVKTLNFVGGRDGFGVFGVFMEKSVLKFLEFVYSRCMYLQVSCKNCMPDELAFSVFSSNHTPILHICVICVKVVKAML